MKATLEFNLPEEQPEFHAACNAQRYASALWDVDQKCREVIKYGQKVEDIESFCQELRGLIPPEIYE